MRSRKTSSNGRGEEEGRRRKGREGKD